MKLKSKLVLGALCAAALLPAQQITGTVTGIATDPSGAVLPGVQVRVTNLQTSVARETNTDASGAFSVPFLPAASYSLTATAKGFRTFQVDSFVLQVGQTARLDLALQLGDVSQTLSVSGSAVALQTESASVGAVINAEKIVDLPLNGRNFIQLAQLIPGVNPGTPGSISVRRGRGSIGETSSAFGGTGMSANGARDTNNRFYLDGVEFMDYDAYTYPFALSVDSLSEFRVETSTFSAEYGGSPGGQVSILTRRGGNQFRGTLWEFNRNDALTQTYDVIARQDITPPRLNRNQYGANIGGPVLFPKLYNGKNKTFFFFNWESGRLASGATASYRLVPPSAMRGGDFSALRDARTGQPLTLRDPMNIGIVNNQIPRSLLSPQAVTFLKYTPEPNTTAGTQNFINTPQSAVATQDNYTYRLDHNLTQKDSLAFRYVRNSTKEKGTPYWGNDVRDNDARTQNLASTWTRMFSSSIVNEARFGWNDMTEDEIFGTTNNPAFDIAGAMNLPLVSRLPVDFGPPSISIANGLDGGYSVFDLQRQIGPRVRANAVFNFNDIVSIQRGKHFFKIGADFVRRGFTFEQARNARGTFRFDGSYTGSSLADFMLGYVKYAEINPDHTNTDLKGLWQSYFLQDDWKIAPNLTMNLGIRYDYLQPLFDSQGRMANIEQNGVYVTKLVTPATASYPRMVRGDKNNFAPRIGLAWRPTFVKDAVVRMGYGIYYNHIHPNAPFGMTESSQAKGSYQVDGSPAGRPTVFFNDPFASAVSPTVQLNAVPSNDPNYRDAYIQQWNFTVQKKTVAGFVVDAGYVASKSTRLSVTLPAMNRPDVLVDPRTPGLPSINARRPNQAFARSIQGDKSIGNSNYHSLQVRADRRMARGLNALTSYTWSKCISGPSDIGADIGGGSFIGTMQNIYDMAGERSLCGFDVTQRFVQSLVYDIPFFSGAPSVMRSLLGGWQASSIIVAQSGFPGDIAFGVDTTGTGVGSRPDVVAGQKANLDGSERTYQRWFNTAAFAEPAFGMYGNSARTGAIRLPGLVNVDFSVNKQFRLGETRRAELRTEFYNLFNHYNIQPGSVDRNIRSVNFGKVGAGLQGQTTRVIQLGAKFYF
ncbi:MAG TPA: TonB-dependent receptor [Bryobacteraceae bacterium]|nr:TonB-dependent receptor [Bryobacteraceae bacterium]